MLWIEPGMFTGWGTLQREAQCRPSVTLQAKGTRASAVTETLVRKLANTHDAGKLSPANYSGVTHL